MNVRKMDENGENIEGTTRKHPEERGEVNSGHEVAPGPGKNDNLVGAILADTVERVDKLCVIFRGEHQRPTVAVKLHHQYSLRVASHSLYCRSERP